MNVADVFRVRRVLAVNGDGTVDLNGGVDLNTDKEVVASRVLCSSGYPHRSPGDTVIVLAGLPIGNLVLCKAPMLDGWSGTDITP